MRQVGRYAVALLVVWLGAGWRSGDLRSDFAGAVVVVVGISFLVHAAVAQADTAIQILRTWPDGTGGPGGGPGLPLPKPENVSLRRAA